MPISLKEAKALYSEKAYKQIKQQISTPSPSKKKSKHTPKLNSGSPAEESFFLLLKHVFSEYDIEREAKLVPNRKFRADFVIKALWISFEVDGLGHHGFNLERLKSDREKDLLTYLEGYQTIRIIASDAMYKQPEVIEKLTLIKEELKKRIR
jgi:very-short-patch-repair endonuclease